VTWAYERDDKEGRNERKLREIEKEKEKESKAEFTHPVSTCIYYIALRFLITYLGFAQSR